MRANHYRYSTATSRPNNDGHSEWNTQFCIPLEGANPNRGLSMIVWDRDRLRKSYIGEIVLPWDETLNGDAQKVRLDAVVFLFFFLCCTNVVYRNDGFQFFPSKMVNNVGNYYYNSPWSQETLA